MTKAVMTHLNRWSPILTTILDGDQCIFPPQEHIEKFKVNTALIIKKMELTKVCHFHIHSLKNKYGIFPDHPGAEPGS